MKYTIYSVDRAGTPWDVAYTSDKELVLSTLDYLRAKRQVQDQVHGVFLTDDPEQGDQEMDIEEDLYDE